MHAGKEWTTIVVTPGKISDVPVPEVTETMYYTPRLRRTFSAKLENVSPSEID